MTPQHLQTILKRASAKNAPDDTSSVPEGVTLTLHVAHGGAQLSVPKIVGVTIENDLVYARTARGDVFAIDLGDVFAVAVDGAPTTAGRRAGFA